MADNRGPLFYAVLFGLASVAVSYHIWSDIWSIANRDEEASHIMLVPFIIAWLVWTRRNRLTQNTNWRQSNWLGIPLILLGAASAWIGLEHGIVALWHASAILTLTGSLCLAIGVAGFAPFLPALSACIFLVPIPGLVRQKLSIPIQYGSAAIAEKALSLFGFDIVRTGQLLTINDTMVNIAEACNGMRMVMSILLVVYACVFSIPLSTRTRLLLLFASPVIAMLLNTVRLTAVVAIYGVTSAETASSFHAISGWLLPLVTIAGFIWFVNPSVDEPSKVQSINDTNIGSSPQWAMVLGVALLAFMVRRVDAGLGQLQIDDHHLRAQQALVSMPFCIDEWIGQEQPLHDAELQLLKPVAAFRRVYRNTTTEEDVTVFATHCRHARDLVGHEPNVCFVGQGWRKVSSEATNFPLSNDSISGTTYVFERATTAGNQSMKVFHTIILPDGTTSSEMKDLAREASDYRKEKLGAASLQFMSLSPKVQENWQSVAASFVKPLAKIATEFGTTQSEIGP